MSGTSRGARVPDLASASAVGDPLALVRDGDLLELDVDAPWLTLHVSDEVQPEDREAWLTLASSFTRGPDRLYIDHVDQADTGAQFDFPAVGPGEDWGPCQPTSH